MCDPGYTFTPPPSSFGGGTGHFTQIVWKTSIKLGVGMAETTMDGNKCIFTVGRYREPGNWGGKFGENVVQGNLVHLRLVVKDIVKRKMVYKNG